MCGGTKSEGRVPLRRAGTAVCGHGAMLRAMLQVWPLTRMLWARGSTGQWGKQRLSTNKKTFLNSRAASTRVGNANQCAHAHMPRLVTHVMAEMRSFCWQDPFLWKREPVSDPHVPVLSSKNNFLSYRLLKIYHTGLLNSKNPLCQEKKKSLNLS